jgi:hypothetical protein
MNVRLRGVSCGRRRQRTKDGPGCRSVFQKQNNKEKQR